MAETVVSLAVKQLGSIILGELAKEGRLVVNVEKEVKKMYSNLTAIQLVLTDAETRQVREAAARDWLEKLKELAFDIEDVLDDWNAGICRSKDMPGDERLERKVCSFFWSLMALIPCFCCERVDLNYDIACELKKLNERLDIIAQVKDRYRSVRSEGNPPIELPTTTSMINITEVKGRDEDKNVLVDKLLSDGSDLFVLSIVGMGGIGKTTLAKFALNDDRINVHFDKKFWVHVSRHFDVKRVATAILTSLLGFSPEVTELEHLLQNIREYIEHKRFILILDDVWKENSIEWDQLKQSLKFSLSGSKILITTRKENVARRMGCFKDNILKIKKLSAQECWLIISKEAFFSKNDINCKNLQKIGREISEKCNGLPLAAKALGGILQSRGTREGWESILNSEIWQLEEEAEPKVIAPQWLSYYDLSPALKSCFSYCAIFPKGREIEKERLIELWMAQDYLNKGGKDDLEAIGEDYFQKLTMLSFFKNSKEDDQGIYSFDGTRRTCKMYDMVHDIVHDLAQLAAGHECLSMKVKDQAESIIGSLPSRVRHLSLDCTNRTSSFNSFDGTKKLRSLLIWGALQGGSRLTTGELSSLFGELTRVRSLSLRYGDFEEIPPSIGKLVQLRLLDLSRNWKLVKLHETLCELHSLQTIDVTMCPRLLLPDGIGKLINLRHLHNRDGPTRLPKGIGELTGLRTLEVVDVGLDENAFSLGDLKNLNQLRGSLEIYDLGAYNRHVGEAKQAELKKKEHITLLRLAFAFPPYKVERLEEELLLEALEPSPDLEILWISNYEGTTFPGWMISLTNLRSICLEGCGPCEHLPSLGKLPSLETLYLWQCDFKKVGLELLGIKTRIGDNRSEIQASSSASSSSSPEVVAFPKLKGLSSSHMESWEEWEDYHDGTAKPPAVNIMPSLRSLEFILCPRLKALPDYILQSTTLDRLYISGCRFLEERYGEEGKDRSKISHIPDVKIY